MNVLFEDNRIKAEDSIHLSLILSCTPLPFQLNSARKKKLPDPDRQKHLPIHQPMLAVEKD
jgi:hypothetical protein